MQINSEQFVQTDTELTPFSLKISRTTGKKSLRKLFLQNLFLCLGGGAFLVGCLSLKGGLLLSQEPRKKQKKEKVSKYGVSSGDPESRSQVGHNRSKICCFSVQRPMFDLLLTKFPDFQKPTSFDSVNIWCIVFFPVLKPLTCGRQSRCLGWTYKLPAGQKFSFKLSPSFWRPLNLIDRPQFINSPGVRFITTLRAIYKDASFLLTVEVFLLTVRLFYLR